MFRFTVPTAMVTSTPGQVHGFELIFPNFNTGVGSYEPFDLASAAVSYTIASTGTPAARVTVSSTPWKMNSGDPARRRLVVETTTSTLANSYVTLQVDNLTNPAGKLSSSLSSMAWKIRTGLVGVDPGDGGRTVDSTGYDGGALGSASAAYTGMARAGDVMVSASTTKIIASNYAASASNVVYSFTFTPTSSIPVGGKIVIVFPSSYDISTAATTTADNDLNGSTAGATYIMSMTTSTATIQGGGTTIKKVTLVTGGANTVARQPLTVVLSGIVNPATAGVYRPVYVYTTLADNGLIDGSTDGFDQADYTNQPPPEDTIHIGGNNTLVFTVYKIAANGTTSTLSAAERAQVKVQMGCPDKQFYVGSRYLDDNSQAIFKNLLDCNYFAMTSPNDSSDYSFWKTMMQPAPLTIAATAGGTAATTTAGISFKVSDAVIVGEIRGTGTTQTDPNLMVRGYDKSGFESMSPIFNVPPDSLPAAPGIGDQGLSATGTGYFFVRAAKNSTWSITFPNSSFEVAASTTYWMPVVPDQVLGSAVTTTLPVLYLVTADKTLTVQLRKSDGTTVVNDACVSVRRAGAGMMMGGMNAVCSPNSGDNYVFKVPTGDMVIQVFRMGKPEEYPVSITTGDVTKMIKMAAPTTNISVTVVDSDGNALNGVPIMARAESGFGFGNAMTNSSGVATVYVPAGSTYEVRGFSSFGPLGPSTGVAVGGNVTFTINTGNLKVISGYVRQGGYGVSGVGIGARGTGSTTGGNGTVTDSDGNYKLYIPAGTYMVGGFSPTTGGLEEQAADVSSGNATVNWTLGGAGTVQVTVTDGGNFCYTTNNVEKCRMMAGAFNSTTNKGNFTDTWSASGNNRIAKLTLPAGDYTLNVGSYNGPLTTEAITVTAGGTTNVAVTAPTLVTVSGTITSGGDNFANIWVSKQGDRGFSVTTDATGAYTLKVPAGTYDMGVNKVGYMPQTFTSLDFSTATSTNVTLSAAGATITGTVTGPSEGFVMARNNADSKMWTGSPMEADGSYSLSVGAGTSWTVFAEGPCYTKSSGLSASAGDSGKNITLTAISGCSTEAPAGQSIIPASGGQMKNGNKATLDIPANALGNGTSAVSVSVSDPDYVNAPAGASLKPMSNSVQKVVASSGSGNITDLNASVTITLSYNESDLPVGFDESKLQAGYWDSTNVRWQSIESTVNTTANTITFTTDHFTEFGPLLPGVPDQVTGLSASAASASAISLSWTAVTGATSYVVYRSSTDSNFTTSIATPTTNSYSDTGLSASTRYYYEVAAVNENGEGLNSSSANAITNAATSGSTGGGGGGGAVIQPAMPIVVSAKINGGVAEVVSANVTLSLLATNASEMAISNDESFAGVSFEPYKVDKYWTLSPGIGNKIVYIKFRSPSGGVTNTTATVKLVAATAATPVAGTAAEAKVTPAGALKINLPASLQVKLGKSLDYGYQFTNKTGKTLKIKLHRTVTDPSGKVIADVAGTRTLAKDKSVSLGLKATVAKNAPLGTYTISIKVTNLSDGGLLDQGSFTYNVQAEGAVAAAVKSRFIKLLTLGSSGDEVKALQSLLQKLGHFTYPTITGYFGAATKKAVQEFQKAQGLAPYPGHVGPATRDALNKLAE